MIEIKVDNTIFNDRIEVMKVRYRTKKPFSPKRANAVIYNMLGDTYNIHRGHDLYKKQFSITDLSPESFNAVFLTPLPENTLKSRAGKHNLTVENIEYNSDKTIPNLSEINKVQLEFTSPTRFYFKDSLVPAFESYLFWCSILSVWYNIKQRQPMLTADKMLTLIYPENISTTRSLVMLDKNLPFYGFTGKVDLIFDKKAIGDIKLFIYLLLEAASYIGVGTKTGWGMGNVKLII